jgi:ATP-dependent RNA helicase RhlE
LIKPLLDSLKEEGYETPTPIQEKAIPIILSKRDLLGCAQTGTGKTAAFALPILQLLAENPPAGPRARAIRCLVLTPTRELAAQIAESFDRYGSNLGLRNTVIFGGVGQRPQTDALRRGVDILVATPGRLLDLMDQRYVDLGQIEIFVLDEADRMLDMGFVHDVKKVLRVLPRKRHSLFFSATMPPDIQRLASEILTNPAKVEITPAATTAEKIQQLVYFVDQTAKRPLLVHLMQDPSISRALVFTRTKHGADKVAKFLNQAQIPAEAIHGNKSQNNRIRALNSFKQGETRVLVATDIAARGIDIDRVTHVINYEIPNIPESYVHRIGRTARAGAEGIAISLCEQEERYFLKDIEYLIRMQITVVPGPYPGSDGKAISLERPMDDRPRGFRGQQRSGQRSHQPRSHSGGRSRNGPRRPSRDESRSPDNRQAPRSFQSSTSQSGTRQQPRDSRRPRHERSHGRSHSRPTASASTSTRKEVESSSTTQKAAPKKSWWQKLTSKK